MDIQEHAGKLETSVSSVDIELHSLCSDVLQAPRQLDWPSLSINNPRSSS